SGLFRLELAGLKPPEEGAGGAGSDALHQLQQRHFAADEQGGKATAAGNLQGQRRLPGAAAGVEAMQAGLQYAADLLVQLGKSSDGTARLAGLLSDMKSGSVGFKLSQEISHTGQARPALLGRHAFGRQHRPGDSRVRAGSGGGGVSVTASA